MFTLFSSFNLVARDYTWIKLTQAIIFISLDIPFGYVLNYFGEFKSLVISLVFGIIVALGYLLSKNLVSFLISEYFLALALSIWSLVFSRY